MELNPPAVFITDKRGDELDAFIAQLNEATRAWTRKAARGECEWICTDCGVSFSDGMPDQCEHGYDECTRIIQRDKLAAKGAGDE
jgi:hypothetical protein